MKANVKPIAIDAVLVRGVELKFNAFNENHLRKWQEVGAEVEARHPGAMDLGVNPELVQNLEGFEDMAEKYAEGTQAFCELFDGIFGEGTSASIFGDEPYYGLCLEVYFEFLEAIDKQGQRYGKRIGSTMSKIAPVGPKGKEK